MGEVEIYYGVLGPVMARQAGRDIDLGWARQRAVLAVLVREMNRPVSTETIIDAVWGERPPDDARRAVQTNISRLRRALHPDDQPGDRHDVLVTTDAGYLLRGAPTWVDTARFEQHLAAAAERHRSGDLPAAAAQLDAALALWRGEPYAGLSGSWIEANGRGGVNVTLPRWNCAWPSISTAASTPMRWPT